MFVREIMTAPAFFVHVEAPLEDVLEMLAVRNATALPVLDDDSRLAGIVSEIDLLKAALSARGERPQDQPDVVRDIMKTEVVTATEGEDVDDVVERISTRKIRLLPVMRGERLVGIVSRSDIVQALYRPDDEIEGELLSDLSDAGLTSCSVAVHRGNVVLTGPADEDERAEALSLARAVTGVRRADIA